MGPPHLQEEVCSPQGSEGCFLKGRAALGSYRTGEGAVSFYF